MPELPEVETIRRDLQTEIVGRTIAAVFLQEPEIVKHPDPEDFLIRLRGKRIESVDRQAKYLLFHLSDGYTWVVHLMLEGQMLYLPEDANWLPETKLIVSLDNGYQLRMRDFVGYAKTLLLREDELGSVLKLRLLGPEPIAPGFTFGVFRQRLNGRKGMIKPLLLNQQIIAGLGNIYVDEALFLAGIHPGRKVTGLSDDELHRIYEAIVQVLHDGIEHRGTSAVRGLYRDIFGKKGSHQEHLRVFRRQGEPCPGCEGVVEQIVVSGRQTFLCPCCQH
ncbi:MAG: bifunctional DNA-formamidopyrimidine glycosylase/DNA-(apurinic or apyrimidinic site) lyase [Candidatus Sericytochromatia bacterium]